MTQEQHQKLTLMQRLGAPLRNGLKLAAVGFGAISPPAVMAQVVFDEAGDEVVTVVVAGVAAQRQRLAGLRARRFERLWVQLLG